jgi:hypothetical protein
MSTMSTNANTNTNDDTTKIPLRRNAYTNAEKQWWKDAFKSSPITNKALFIQSISTQLTTQSGPYYTTIIQNKYTVPKAATFSKWFKRKESAKIEQYQNSTQLKIRKCGSAVLSSKYPILDQMVIEYVRMMKEKLVRYQIDVDKGLDWHIVQEKMKHFALVLYNHCVSQATRSVSTSASVSTSTSTSTSTRSASSIRMSQDDYHKLVNHSQHWIKSFQRRHKETMDFSFLNKKMNRRNKNKLQKQQQQQQQQNHHGHHGHPNFNNQYNQFNSFNQYHYDHNNDSDGESISDSSENSSDTDNNREFMNTIISGMDEEVTLYVQSKFLPTSSSSSSSSSTFPTGQAKSTSAAVAATVPLAGMKRNREENDDDDDDHTNDGNLINLDDNNNNNNNNDEETTRPSSLPNDHNSYTTSPTTTMTTTTTTHHNLSHSLLQNQLSDIQQIQKSIQSFQKKHNRIIQQRGTKKMKSLMQDFGILSNTLIVTLENMKCDLESCMSCC